MPRGEPVLHDNVAKGNPAPETTLEKQDQPANAVQTVSFDRECVSGTLSRWDQAEPEPVKPVTPKGNEAASAPASNFPEMLGVIKERDSEGNETRYAVVLYPNGQQAFLGFADRGDGFGVAEIGDDYMLLNTGPAMKRINLRAKRQTMLGSIIPANTTGTAVNGNTPPTMTEAMRAQMEEQGVTSDGDAVTSAVSNRGRNRGRTNYREMEPDYSAVPMVNGVGEDAGSANSAGREGNVSISGNTEGRFGNRARAVPARPNPDEDN